MLSDNKFNLLLQRVVFDHEILTHRVVARSFKVDTLKAKRILAEFVSRSEGRAHATYIVTGYIRSDLEESQAIGNKSSGSNTDGFPVSSNNSNLQLDSTPPRGNGDVNMLEDAAAPPSASDPQAGPSSQPYTTELQTLKEPMAPQIECAMLIAQEDLEDKLSLFVNVLSQEVYSAEPSRLPDFVLLTDANAPVLRNKELAEVGPDVLGTVKHYRQNPRKTGKANKSTASTSIAPSITDKGKDKEKEKKKEPTAQMPALTNKLDLKRKASGSELANKSMVNGKITDKTTTSLNGKMKSNESLSRQVSNGPSLDDLFNDAAETKRPAVPSIKETKKPAPEIDYDDMLAEDDDMMAELEGMNNEPAPAKGVPAKASAPEPTSSKVTVQSGRRKKVRKVKRKEVTVNAKGFKVTKEVETEEEYSASESDDDGPTVASSSTINKPKEGRGNPAAQDSKTAKEPVKTKEPEKAKEKPKEKEEKRPPTTKSGSSNSNLAKKLPPGGQTSLAGFFGKPKPKK